MCLKRRFMYNLTRRALFQAAGRAVLPAAQSRRPNILLLFPDQLRFDWTSANADIKVQTPNLDRITRKGFRFTHAVVASPLCAPSRACLASGREYDRCGTPSNTSDYPLSQITYYRLLRDAGYHVLGCGKLDLHKKTEDWGLDGKRLLKEWGFSDGIDNEGKNDAIHSGAKQPKGPYMAYLHDKGLAEAHVADFRMRKPYDATFPTPLPESAYCDNWLAENGLRLLRAVPAGKPWHLTVNFTGPHDPMDITRGMELTVRGRQFPQPNRNSQFSPQTHIAIRQNYTAMVENIDRWVGIYLDEIETRGESGNTIVVFSSDHGEMLGDHDRWAKQVPYHPSVSVPLLAMGPGIGSGVNSDAPVSIMDLAATFLDYASVQRPDDMDSRSLRPLLEGRTKSHREYVLSGLGSWRMVWDGRYKLMTGFDPTRRNLRTPVTPEEQKSIPPILFDLRADPLENKDLVAANATRARDLAQLLSAP